MAVGRRPRVEALDLDAAGVKVDELGFIAVDEELRTSNAAIFAAGDVIGGPQYVYVVAAQGNLAAENVPRALANQGTRGVIKLVADAGSGKVLGGRAASAWRPSSLASPAEREKRCVVVRYKEC